MVFYYAKKVKYLTSREYELELKKIKAQNRQIEMKRNLKAAKVKRFNIPKISTSKLILVAVLLLNLQIIYFVEKAIMTYGDLSALYALIAIPATLIPTVWAYFSKAKAENCAGGITYDSAMEQLRQSSSKNDEAVG
ncbi:hypothetical protein DW955_11690 [Ruminococcus sp. AM45-9BH]|nr:hypothetical protein DW955_11690 [Ruminococcus sp. AM45-9BH]RHS76760.1 hypothetical protein DW953_03930 [Ruminococcus sp. AM45-2]